MKTCDEMMNSLFERRKQYVAAQRKKKKMLASGAASLCAVSLLGGGVWYLGQPRHNAPVTVTPNGDMQTTTAADDTTATTADGTTTTGTVVKDTTAPSTTEPTASKPPSTTGKTRPTETTATTTAPTKLLITATDPDYEFAGEALCSRYRIYISSRLRHYMEMFEGEDVNYAVIVSIPPLSEDYEESKVCNEELVQALQEYQRVYDLYAKEAKQLNPSWSGASSNEIEVWTDTMRANYEQYLLLLDRYRSLEEKYRGPYVQTLLDGRFAVMQEMSASKLVDVECYELSDAGFTWHAYYAELSAETIQALAELGGYTFRLASRNDYGYWQIDE